MASIVAYIELREGAITGPSRFVVAEARRIADSAGASVFALLTVGSLSHAEMDRLASEVSAAGADRVLCSSASVLAGPALDVTHGALLAQVAEQLRPVLILFPAGGAGDQLGPALAVRIGAAYMANASIDICPEDREPELPSQRVLVSRWRAARDGQRKIDVGDLERPVIASLAAGAFPPPAGEPYAEVEMVICPDARFPEARVVDCESDASARFELCQTAVWAGRTTSSETVEAIQAELPLGTCLAAGDEAEASFLRWAVPCGLYILPSAQSMAATDWPLLVPGAGVTRIGADARGKAEPTGSPGTATEADGDLAQLAAALARARSKGTSP